MYAASVNVSSDHVPQSASGRRYFFVGDGSEALFVSSREIECLDEARRLNRAADTDCHTVYCVDVDERDADGNYLFATERELVRQNFGD